MTGFKNSSVYRAARFLFSDNYSYSFDKTIVSKFMPKLLTRGASLFLVVLSIILLWYEKPIERLLPLLAHDFLPFILLFLALVFVPKERLIIRKYHLWLLVFLIILLLTGFIGVFKFSSGIEIILGWLVYLFFGIALVIGESLKEKKALYVSLILISLPIIFFGVLQVVLGGGLNYSYFETSENRITSFLGNPNIFGLVLVILVFLCSDLFFRAGNKVQKITVFFLGASLLVLLLSTGSRTAGLSFIVGGLVFLLVSRARLILYSPLILLFFLPSRVRERAFSGFCPEYILNSATQGRIWSLRNSLYIWEKNIFGTGPGTYGGRFAREYSSAVYLEGMQRGYPALLTTDNQYLALLVQGGILGILSFLGFWISLASALFTRKTFLGASLLASFLVMMGFSNAMEFGVVAIPIGVLIGSTLSEGEK